MAQNKATEYEVNTLQIRLPLIFAIITQNHFNKGEKMMYKDNNDYYAKVDQELEENERKIKPDSLPGESTMLAYALIFGIVFVIVALAIIIF